MFPGSYLHARYVSVAQIFSSKSTRYFSQVRRRDKLGRLKPLSLSARVSLLRSHGILQIDRRESAAIERIQVLSSSHILVTDTLAMSSAVNHYSVKLVTTAFTFKTLLRHYAKQAWTPL